MKPLNKLQNFILQLGGVMLVIGAMMPLYLPFAAYAPYVYTIGAVLFATMQMMNKYEGKNIILKRLRRQQLIGALLLIVSGAMMFGTLFKVGPFTNDEWKLALAIGAVLEVYTAFRIPAVLNQENK